MPFRTAIALAIAAACAFAPATADAAVAQCAGADAMPAAQGTAATADAVTCLVNAERTSRGMRAVRRNADLGQAARGHSSDMVRHDYFSHTGTGGTDLGDRLHAAGFGRTGSWRAGEAIGYGTGSLATPRAIVAAWLNSPPHRHILLDRGFREVGVGIALGAPSHGPSRADSATYTLDFAVVTGR